MSHFAVLITLPGDVTPETLEAEIGRRLARYDEGLAVEPYREYEDGAADDHWWVGSVRRGAQEHRDDAPIEIRHDGPVDKPGKIYKSGAGYVTEDEYVAMEKAERADDAVWAEQLGEHPSWEDVVRLYNEKWHPGNEIAVQGDVSTNRLQYEEESGRAYEWSTYNPDAKFDYWRIGGRWGGYFRLKADAPGVVRARSGWDSPKVTQSGIRGDAALKGLIDFEAMRQDAAVEAHETWDAWEQLVREQFQLYNEPPKSWRYFIDLKEAGEIDLGEARRRYHDQPLIKQLRKSQFGDAAPGPLARIAWDDDPVATFGSTTREEYVAQRRLAAVPAYALVTLDGEWIAPGRMGWFGMSSDGEDEREGYRRQVNEYLDSLSDDTLIVALDLHI